MREEERMTYSCVQSEEEEFFNGRQRNPRGIFV
jgi:hypothetical protein